MIGLLSGLEAKAMAKIEEKLGPVDKRLGSIEIEMKKMNATLNQILKVLEAIKDGFKKGV